MNLTWDDFKIIFKYHALTCAIQFGNKQTLRRLYLYIIIYKQNFKIKIIFYRRCYSTSFHFSFCRNYFRVNLSSVGYFVINLIFVSYLPLTTSIQTSQISVRRMWLSALFIPDFFYFILFYFFTCLTSPWSLAYKQPNMWVSAPLFQLFVFGI